jgi:AmmeMemoRadiSam system protein B
MGLSAGNISFRMILPKLRANLDIMLSPVADRPGLFIRDSFRYSDAQLIIPPPLISGLRLFDGVHTNHDLRQELTRVLGSEEIDSLAENLFEALSVAGFLDNETYIHMKQQRLAAFVESPVLPAAHAGSAYPAEIAPLRSVMQGYLEGAASTQQRVIGIAAPHVSPHGGWQSYRAAYQELTPELRDRTFVVLGTSHYGQPDTFGLTRKPFTTPFGTTRIDSALVNELGAQPGVLMEDYCLAVEHSIEFQVVFLQSIFGPDIRVLPILCGSFSRGAQLGGPPEADEGVKRFFAALGEVAEREKDRLFWILGVDMAHMGQRYGDKFAAHADQDEMALVRERDMLRIEQINAADARGFWDLIKEKGDDLKWCGTSPFYTFMKAVPRARGTTQRYEQWNIDERSVVSFAGISFTS